MIRREITVDVRNKILNMLSNGISLRKISRETGIGRETIKKIGSKDGCYKLKLMPLQTCKPKRCEVCGGLVVIWPCLLCNPETGYYEEKNVTVKSLEGR